MSTFVSHPRHHRAQRARGALWLIVLAVLTVQTLSLLHGVAHAGRFGQVRADASCPATAFEVRGAPKTPASHPGSWLDAMFGAQAGHDCKAFDQASHADLVGAVPSAIVFALPPDEPTSVHVAWHHAAQARGFLARGPPLAA